MEKYFVVDKLYKTYSGGYNILSSVSFSLDRGDKLAILGGNGSGKTTLLYTLCGLENVSNGKILVDGREVSGNLKENNIGYLPETLPFYENKSVEYNLKKSLNIRKIEKSQNYDNLIKIFEIENILSTKVKKLSNFDKIKVAFCRLFMLDRKLYLVDNVLPTLSETEINYITKILEKLTIDKTIIFAISSMQLVEKVCANKLALLSYGTITDYESVDKKYAMDNTASSIKLVQGEGADISVDIVENGVKICDTILPYNKKIFSNVFTKGMFVVPKSKIKVSDNLRFSSKIIDIVNGIIIAEDGNNTNVFYGLNTENYNVGEYIYFDFDIDNLPLFDIGSERKITL